MPIDSEQLALQLENPFKLSYGASTVRHNVLIHLESAGYMAVGEAAVVPYYAITPEQVIQYFASLPEPDIPVMLEDALDQLPSAGSSFARAAADMALHDLWGQQLGQPLYSLWGLNPERCPQNSFTVAMADDEASYRTRLQAASKYPLIKLKLGTGDPQSDLALVKIARAELPEHTLCVDANGGWTAEQGQAVIPLLAAMGITFIEQPVAKEDFDGWHDLKKSLPAGMPPLIADESVQGVASVPHLVGLVDGINIKLAKCGGLRPARQMIALARAYGMRVMIGCMIESSVAITAAAHLAPLADYADLDGNLLITNDPYAGVIIENGRLTLPTAPGLGVTRRVE